ncbi:MAG TPA: long-chain fatty acid--CoA ligase [Thermoanaerobaculia bacterium]|jgi:fatty-acyl-CoA synthase|nr:long-chain fatty acid--CoA ligase [Thermoanaerobaculia bacterium]
MISGDLLGERARLTPEKTALVYVPTGERLSYAELDARAVRVARVFRESLGLAKGDRFALLADNRIEMLDAFFAAPKAGVVLVPLGTRLTAHELAGILDDARPAGLLYGAEHAETVRALKDLVSLDRWVALDEPVEPGDLSLQDLVRVLPTAAWTRERCDPEDLWCLLYTSGTTGKPKGVMLPHRMIVWNGYNTVTGWQLRADDVSPVFTPLYHAGGLAAFLVPIFTIGGTIVLHRGFDAAEVWQTIEQERCTVVLGVPTIFKLLMEDPGFVAADLSQVRWFISGGAPLPTYIIDAYQRRGVAFKQGYGLTEVGVNCFAMTVEESVAKPGSIGKPMMFTETRLVGEDGAPVPVGEVGELLLRGPHVCRGYWNNPEATAAALGAEGWFHTGDLARQDADGFHFIAGRQKDMIISGGVNVYPAEIEGELLLHPGVRDAAVVGVPHPTWGEAGVAFVVPGGEAPAPEDLAAFLGERLAKYKIPREFVFVDALPRTPYGKVVKGELRETYLRDR